MNKAMKVKKSGNGREVFFSSSFRRYVQFADECTLWMDRWIDVEIHVRLIRHVMSFSLRKYISSMCMYVTIHLKIEIEQSTKENE